MSLPGVLAAQVEGRMAPIPCCDTEAFVGGVGFPLLLLVRGPRG